ncbi:DinB family protein [Martelella soudanensis]|uniref:DinB family protein n=1 Tax=unclassified Martelella TaxID=2629616 RepID=UPI0015DFDC60|nr:MULTISPECIES: DinB family protein [unclassified Martelella]
MLQHYRRFAAYNAWANDLVYAAAAELPDEDYRRELGAFFPSVHATLNHVLYADGVWMTRFAGQDTGPVLLDTILFEDFQMLKAAREEMDRKIIGFIGGLDSVEGTFSYRRGNPPQPYTDRLGTTLAHFFNHQTHHRGQVHMMLTMLGRPSLTLDMSYFLRTPEGRALADA